MTSVHSGGCLCGAVRFSVAGTPGSVVACHCSQCRRQSGHYWASTDVAEDELTVLGEDVLTWFSSSDGVRRGFCSRCGSTLFWKRQGRADMSVGAGCFDMPSGLSMSRHIYCDDKGDYYEIDHGLPRHGQGRTSPAA